MIDLEIHLEDQPGALAALGTALGAAGVSVEGGGAWVIGGRGIAHFLFRDGIRAERALMAAGITVAASREAVLLHLKQEVPGQLGLLAGRMAGAGVSIEALYSDHNHRLVLVVNDTGKALHIADEWMSNQHC